MLFDEIKCHSVFVEKNPHKGVYQTVEEWSRVTDTDEDDWGSLAEYHKAIATDTIWEIRVHRHSPGGFILFLGATYENVYNRVLAYHREQDEEQTNDEIALTDDEKMKLYVLANSLVYPKVNVNNKPRREVLNKSSAVLERIQLALQKTSPDMAHSAYLATMVLNCRIEVGKKKYKEPLKTWNGRDPLFDALQEAADLFNYLLQYTIEEETTKLDEFICDTAGILIGLTGLVFDDEL